jgi:phage-related protein
MKKTQKTPQKDIDLVVARYKALMSERKERGL